MSLPPVVSACQWGSPTAHKRALLIHGLNSSSHTFHRVASMLAAKGYVVVAPNLLGHASRKPGADFRIQTLADDLLTYLEAAEYDVVLGHSMGALVVLSLLKYLPNTKAISIVLLDPILEMTVEQTVKAKVKFSSSQNFTVDDYMALNPQWIREDAMWKVLGNEIGRVTNVVDHIDGNVPWSFSHLIADKPPAAKLTILTKDPRLDAFGVMEDVAKFIEVKIVIVPNASHWIHYDFPEVVVNQCHKGQVHLM